MLEKLCTHDRKAVQSSNKFNLHSCKWADKVKPESGRNLKVIPKFRPESDLKTRFCFQFGKFKRVGNHGKFEF